jgi:hypothetical protein
MRRLFVCVAVISLGPLALSGCSGGSTEGEVHKVKDLKSRGLGDSGKDPLPARKDFPAQRKADAPGGK